MEGKNELRFWLAIRELPSAQFVSLADCEFHFSIEQSWGDNATYGIDGYNDINFASLD